MWNEVSILQNVQCWNLRLHSDGLRGRRKHFICVAGPAELLLGHVLFGRSVGMVSVTIEKM